MYLVLGTAQLGLDQYGVNNKTGQPTETESINMIQNCLQNGVVHFDTAQAYGTSETILGNYRTERRDGAELMQIATKLNPEITKTHQVEENIKQSLQKLGYAHEALPMVYLHRSSQYSTDVWPYLVHLKRIGIIRELGISYQVLNAEFAQQKLWSVREPEVSVRGPEVPPTLLDPDVSLIQVPFNILDQRWDPIITFAQTRRTSPLKVHVRSIYLQGLLLSDKSTLSVNGYQSTVSNKIINKYDIGYIHDTLDKFAEKYQFQTRQELCWSQIVNRSWIDGIIVGAEHWSQMEENIKLLG